MDQNNLGPVGPSPSNEETHEPGSASSSRFLASAYTTLARGRKWVDSHSQHLGWLGTAAVVVTCLATTMVFCLVLDRHYPIRQWLFWHLAAIWGWELVFTVACLSVGNLLLVKALRISDLPRLETLVASMALGVISFTVAMCIGGALALYRSWFAVALPITFVIVGLPATVPWLRKLKHNTFEPKRIGLLTASLMCVGALCVGILYLQSMTPDCLSCDAKWFHVTAAQDYAREGKIIPFMADWAKNLPQLTSILHTWAFLVPGLQEPVRWMMALHTEFMLFLWTLAGVVTATRWLAHKEGADHAWVAFFLFPGIFIYDSNLGGAADHVLAFFSLPLLVAGLRAVERPGWRMALVAGLMAGAGLMTKMQAVYVIAPIGVLLLVVGACGRSLLPKRVVDRSGARDAWLSAACFGGAMLLAFSPHLIKNWVFHHNPVYPFLMAELPGSTPTIPDGPRLFNDHLAHVGTGPLWPRLKNALPLIFTFPFEFLSDHAALNLPFIGALFSLLLPAAFFVRVRRLWAAIFVATAAVVGWAIGFPTPRNLQTFLPILVVVSAAIIALVWDRGWMARAAIVPLIGLQVVWGADELFSSGSGRVASAMDLINSGSNGAAKSRFSRYRSEYRDVGKALPNDAVLLLHTTYEQLGINRRILLDWPGFQGLIDYRPMHNARDVYDRFRAVGITHIATDPQWPAHSRQEEVVFDAFLRRHAISLGHIGQFDLWRMPTESPPAEPAYRVLCLGLGAYPDGLYQVDKLNNFDEDVQQPRQPDVPIRDPMTILELTRLSDAVVVSSEFKIEPSSRALLTTGFIKPVVYPTYSVHIRRGAVSRRAARERVWRSLPLRSRMNCDPSAQSPEI